MMELINFKWNSYGLKWHSIGCCFNFFYIILLNFYVAKIYLVDPYDAMDEESANAYHKRYTMLLNIGIIYSLIYETGEIYYTGVTLYYSQLSNYIDSLYIFCNVLNIIFQYNYHPHNIICVIVMTLILDLSLVETFTFIRIFEAFSPIVTMLRIVFF